MRRPETVLYSIGLHADAPFFYHKNVKLDLASDHQVDLFNIGYILKCVDLHIGIKKNVKFFKIDANGTFCANRQVASILASSQVKYCHHIRYRNFHLIRNFLKSLPSVSPRNTVVRKAGFQKNTTHIM